MAVDGIKRIPPERPDAADRPRSGQPEYTVRFPDIDDLKKMTGKTERPPEKARSNHIVVTENGREVRKSINNDTLTISVEGKMTSGYFQALTGSFEAMYDTQQSELTPDRIVEIYSNIFSRLMTAVEQSFAGSELENNISSLQKAYNGILAEYGGFPEPDDENAGAAPGRKVRTEPEKPQADGEPNETELKARELLLRYSGAGDINSAIASAFVQLNSQSPGTISYTQLYKLAVSMDLSSNGQS